EGAGGDAAVVGLCDTRWSRNRRRIRRGQPAQFQSGPEPDESRAFVPDGRRVGQSPVLAWTAREPGCRLDVARSGVRAAPAHLAGKDGDDFHGKGELGALVEIRRNQTPPGAAPQTGW